MNAKDKFILGFCRLGIAGLSPKAPGTCGTALALVFAPFLFLPFGLTGRVVFFCCFLSQALWLLHAEKSCWGRRIPEKSS